MKILPPGMRSKITLITIPELVLKCLMSTFDFVANRVSNFFLPTPP
jgi:hypothetical protein